METKPLLYGLIGFFLGGLIVSTAAATIDKPTNQTEAQPGMVETLEGKQGDDFDRAFIEGMIVHHQGAIDMAELAATQAGHSEVKDLSLDIIDAQQAEIAQMQDWQRQWGYPVGAAPQPHSGH